MKVEQIINEMQASLTKLRGHFRITGTGTGRSCAGGCGRSARHGSNFCEYYFAGTGWGCEPPLKHTCQKCGRTSNFVKVVNLECVCPFCAPNLTGTADECTCDPEYPDSKNQCDAHRIAGECKKGRPCVCESCMDEYYRAVLRGCYKKEWEKQHAPDLPLHVRVAKALGNIVWNAGSPGWWMSKDGYGNYIPDYPNDLVAAMGALEEYCSKNTCFPEIRYYARKRIEERYWSWDITLESHENKIAITDKSSLPQAICEAIVAYSEGKC